MTLKISSVLSDFSAAIALLKKENIYRRLIDSNFIGDNLIHRDQKKLISFCSNDYLGLANHRKVRKSAIKAIKKYGASSKSSRYIVGNNSLYSQIERKLAKIFNCDSSIVFSSGYQTAIGVIPVLAKKGDLIIADKLIHSCLIDGAKLSGAKLIRYLHNDLQHLKKIISENKDDYDKILIISEEVFSMDGDLCDVDGLQEIAIEYDSLLLVDCAHSLYQKPFKRISEENVLFMGTFSKSLGSFGGYITGCERIIDYLRNFAKSAIYTTALPPATLAANLQALELICKKNLANKTISNVKYFCNNLNVDFPGSAIVIIDIDDVNKVLTIARKMEERGFLISAIRPPTSTSARLRITINASHKEKEMDRFIAALKLVLQEEKIQINPRQS